MNCIIVDDDETSRFILSNLVKKIDGTYLVGSCKNTIEARQLIEEKEVHIVLLDIEMPGETGIEMFEKMSGNIDVIFITSQVKHAISAFENDAVDYIVKPVDLNRLNKAFDKAKRRLISNEEENDQEFIFIKEKTTFEKIFLKDIKFIESSQGYVTFYTTYKKVTMNGTLKKIMDKLNSDQFIQVHRSYLININKVTKYVADSIYVGDTELPLSRMYKKDVVSFLDKITL